MKAVDHNIYYLVSNKYLAIEYKVENKNNKLITITNKVFTAAANASYRNNPNSRSGKKHIFKLFKGAINWSSKSIINSNNINNRSRASKYYTYSKDIILVERYLCKA